MSEYDVSADAIGSFNDVYAGVRGARKATELIGSLRAGTPHDIIRSIYLLLVLGYEVTPPPGALNKEP